jgi:hypothetical protein
VVAVVLAAVAVVKTSVKGDALSRNTVSTRGLVTAEPRVPEERHARSITQHMHSVNCWS